MGCDLLGWDLLGWASHSRKALRLGQRGWLLPAAWLGKGQAPFLHRKLLSELAVGKGGVVLCNPSSATCPQHTLPSSQRQPAAGEDAVRPYLFAEDRSVVQRGCPPLWGLSCAPSPTPPKPPQILGTPWTPAAASTSEGWNDEGALSSNLTQL